MIYCALPKVKTQALQYIYRLSVIYKTSPDEVFVLPVNPESQTHSLVMLSQ